MVTALCRLWACYPEQHRHRGVPTCWLNARLCKIELSPSFRDQILGLASGSWGKRAVLGKGERLSAGSEWVIPSEAADIGTERQEYK